MSVFRKFSRNDILFSTVSTRPKVEAVYGVNGWSANTGPSASLSLYGGVRARRDVRFEDFGTSGLSLYPLDPLDTNSIDKVIFVSGSYPSTGSIRYVRCTDVEAPSIFSVTDVRWYEEHYRPIELLYDFYSGLDSNYFLGSYDFYTPLLIADPLASAPNQYIGPYYVFSGSFASHPITGPSSSFTAMAWVKPIPLLTSSLTAFAPTIMGQKGIWNIFVNVDESLGLRTPTVTTGSTAKLNLGEWNHVAVSVSGGLTASFYINGELSDTIPISGGMHTGSDLVPLIVGAQVSPSGTYSAGWNGFLFDTQVWGKVLSSAEINTYMVTTVTATASLTDLLHYARFNDGPSGVAHGFVSGSGALDHSNTGASGYSVPWSVPNTPHWQPNDHPTFIPQLDKTNLDIHDIRVTHVPSLFYGKQIEPGSVVLTDGAYNKRHIVRVFNDDGRGTLYVSGSMTRAISDEDYTGEKRRKVGNVFYSEGLIVITDPALYDVFASGTFWDVSEATSAEIFADLLEIDFRGQGKIYTKTFNCRFPTAQANASNNPTFTILDDRGTADTSDDRLDVVREDGTTYITAVGLYNEDRQLVAVAKLAQPIRKREKDKLNIRLKMDF